MSKYAFSFVILIFITSFPQFASAQERIKLKGPKAKNYEPWRDKSSGYHFHTSTNVVKPKGPKAKNQQAYAIDSENMILSRAASNTMDKPKGPKAKNTRPWDRN